MHTPWSSNTNAKLLSNGTHSYILAVSTLGKVHEWSDLTLRKNPQSNWIPAAEANKLPTRPTRAAYQDAYN